MTLADVFYITPEKLVEARRTEGERELGLGEVMVIFYDGEIFRLVREITKPKKADGWLYAEREDRRVYEIVAGNHRVNLMKLDMGAPLLAFIIEMLRVHGVRRIVICTSAGSLYPRIDKGQLFLIKKAFSRNGVTQRYFPGIDSFESVGKGDDNICDLLKNYVDTILGTVAVSTDAIFCESIDEVKQYRQVGAEVIDMEAATAFAMARHCGVAVTVVGYVSDALWGGKWYSFVGNENVVLAKEQLAYCLSSYLGG